MLSPLVGFKDVEPQPVRPQFPEHIVEDAAEHDLPNATICVCDYDPLQTNGAMGGCDSAQDGKSGQLSGAGLSDEITAIGTRQSRVMLVFRPVADKGAIFRDAFHGCDRRNILHTRRSQPHVRYHSVLRLPLRLEIFVKRYFEKEKLVALGVAQLAQNQFS